MPRITAPSLTGLVPGTHAARPAASSANAGLPYYETDTGLAFVSDGAAWQSLKPGQEIAYGERTSDSPATTSAADVGGGATVTITLGARPYNIEWGCTQFTGATAGEIPILQVTDNANTVISQVSSVIQSNGGTGAGVHGRKRMAANSGAAVTYKLRIACAFSTSVVAKGSAASPIWLQLTEV